MFRLIFIIFLLFFGGCALKEVKKANLYIVTIKSKKLKFNDYAVIKRYSNNSIHLKIYNAGNLIEEIKIDSKICTKKGCVNKKEFNKKYFVSYYPDDLLKNVILKKPIFNSKNLIKKDKGFIQKVYKKNCYDIIYIVNNSEVFFKDKINKILIKIKEINE